jgi:hypothetical protein
MSLYTKDKATIPVDLKKNDVTLEHIFSFSKGEFSKIDLEANFKLHKEKLIHQKIVEK